MRRQLVTLLTIALAGLAAACMWDYDTFAAEAAGKNGVVEVLAGRFERNPPLYYEMRLKRCLEELHKDPTNLDLYDNAAVAAERLGQSDQAIEIIERKRARMKPLTANKEDWYRYHANLGTFIAHKAMKHTPKGIEKAKNPRQQKELALARDHIRRAIEINPDAHFGREKYQLHVIEWLLSDKESGWPYWEYLDSKGEMDKPADVIRGMSGLIRLGTAWENVDIWGTLTVALSAQSDSSLSHFALARVEELERQKKRSVVSELNIAPSDAAQNALPFSDLLRRSAAWTPTDEIVKENRRIYADLRAQGDEWHRKRTEYIEERLKQGRHPDWDKEFWADWKDEPKLSIPQPPKKSAWIYPIVSGGVVAVFVGLLAARRRRKAVLSERNKVGLSKD